MQLNDAAKGFITNFNFLFKSISALIISFSIATIAFALSMLVGIGILAIMAAKASTVSAATAGLVAGTVVAAANPIGLIAFIAGSALLALALSIGFFCKRATPRSSRFFWDSSCQTPSIKDNFHSHSQVPYGGNQHSHSGASWINNRHFYSKTPSGGNHHTHPDTKSIGTHHGHR